jgi:4-amino-4-deoxy-L-arabinose transferase-like glycosyltransferase
MNNLFKIINNNRLLFIILLATVLRIIPFIIYEPWKNKVVEDNILVSDAREYHELALYILDTGSYPKYTFISTRRTPAYPWFLAFVYSLTGINPYIVLLLQVLLNLVSLILVYKIATLFFDNKIASLAAFLYAIDPVSILYVQTLLADTIVTTIFLLSIWFLFCSFKNERASEIILSGIFLGLAVLTKPVFQYFPVIVFIMIVISFNKAWKNTLKYSLLFISGFVLVVTPLLYHNYNLYNKPAISTVVGRNLLFENAARLMVKVENISFVEAQKKMRLMAAEKGSQQLINPFEKEKLYKKTGIDYIKDHLPSYIAINIRGVVLMYFTPGSTLISKILNHDYTRIDDSVNLKANPGLGHWVIGFFKTRRKGEVIISVNIILFYLVIYLFFLYAIPFLNKNKSFKLFFISSLLIIMYITVLTGPVGHARLRLPINPFIIIISSVGIHHLILKKKRPLADH